MMFHGLVISWWRPLPSCCECGAQEGEESGGGAEGSGWTGCHASQLRQRRADRPLDQSSGEAAEAHEKRDGQQDVGHQ